GRRRRPSSARSWTACSRIRRRRGRRGVPRAPEAQVVEGAVRRGVAPTGHAVVAAEVLAAHPGAAAHHALPAGPGPLRAARRARAVVGGAVPVGAPFPDVADDVVEAVAVGREATHRSAAAIAVLPGVALGKDALPPVRHEAAAGTQLVSPRVGAAGE